MKHFSLSVLFVLAVLLSSVSAESPFQSSADFNKYAMRMRESALTSLGGPRVVIPTSAGPTGIFGGGYPWKRGIYTTVFWVGENASKNNPVHNRASSWDANWAANFGGYDNPDPSARRNYLPIGFTPRQNPFYYALPYNDVTRGMTKPEAKVCIPWFKKTFVKEGQSVCRDRWIAIKAPNGRVCYAQWSDCGPFRTDHWQYVFGNERPKPNLNKGAGLDISPAVRDYLGVGSMSVLDWRFVEFRDVPKGPWSLYGDNNHFVQAGRNSGERVVSNAPAATRRGEVEARVITK